MTTREIILTAKLVQVYQIRDELRQIKQLGLGDTDFWMAQVLYLDQLIHSLNDSIEEEKEGGKQ